eukprot:scaffold3671_cov51-Isochrysis_galbana.AAC.1
MDDAHGASPSRDGLLDHDGDVGAGEPALDDGPARCDLREIATWLECHRININVRQVAEEEGWDATLAKAEA